MSNSEPLIETELTACLEALLFVAAGPVTVNQLAEALGKPTSVVEKGLHTLDERYQVSSGLRLQWQAGKIQLTTSAKMGELIERFLGLEIYNKMSKAALETLAVICYQQPVTKPYVDSIRGVNSDGVVKNLLNKGLIQEVGRSDGPGRPIMYGTTTDFLQYFGLNSIKDLPAIDEMSAPAQETNRENKILKD